MLLIKTFIIIFTTQKTEIAQLHNCTTAHYRQRIFYGLKKEKKVKRKISWEMTNNPR